MSWLNVLFPRWGRLRPAPERTVVIREPMSFRANVMKNRLWYRGEPAELEQFFRQTAIAETDRARFWAAAPQSRVRKLHSGLVGTVVDRYRDIVLRDFDGFCFGQTEESHALQERWETVAAACRFEALLGEAVTGALVTGDGAFKLYMRPGDTAPRAAFYEADRVEYEGDPRCPEEIRFYTPYRQADREYRLEECYGRGYVRYRLTDEEGRDIPLSRLDETCMLQNAAFDRSIMLAVPFMILGGGKWPGRGKALFDGKTDSLDALDEVLSQWIDAVRMGRVKRYIPEDLVPRDPETGRVMEPNPFDNAYIAVGSSCAEGTPEKIEVSQPEIAVEAYHTSWAAFLDMALQGVMSPTTLGIDLKKTDNAEAQREKEQITLHVRGRIVDALSEALPRLAEVMLQAEDLMAGRRAGTYRLSARFGEYANPDFGSAVESVAKARSAGIMSVEQAVEELYGDAWSPEDKAAEARRIRGEQDAARKNTRRKT